jgi:hypothetical protein
MLLCVASRPPSRQHALVGVQTTIVRLHVSNARASAEGWSERAKGLMLCIVAKSYRGSKPSKDVHGVANRGDAFLDHGSGIIAISPEAVMYGAAVAIFGKAFLETLGSRTGESAANLPGRVVDLVRARKRRSGKTETYLSVGSSAATIVVTEDLPDEARLALLELDVTTAEVRGKQLFWDSHSQAWVARKEE